ncbi:MAG: peptidoglycan editing factor PgeF [Pseudomonadales bacterium]
MLTELPASWVAPPAAFWPAGVRALTTSRIGPDGGASWNLADHVGDDPARVAGNRRVLMQRTGVGAVQWLAQVHGSRCIEATPARVDRVPEADAAWTRHAQLGLAVLSADCVPVVVCDRAGTLVGVAHGGWRGLVGGVLEGLIAALPVAPSELVAWLGPAIGPGAYEVGGDVVDAVAAMDAGGELVNACFRASDPAPGKGADAGRVRLDLFALGEQLLRRAGVREVLGGRWCTYSDERWFSYRREGRTGRMATLAWLEAR